ncbi:hypothetical protein EU537_01880 [Candidatus Thorarchaeota archaeon]|nr:MAG: hypothetical protein EU537_01880 [Candidatus Thorarchaeota archaeon]
MTTRIAHISDTHLGTRPGTGVRQNVWAVEMRTRLLENDFYERFEELFKKIGELEPKVELVVHSGDLYNSPWEGNPTQPPVVAQETAIRILKDFTERTEIPVFILEGNHGIYRTLEVSLLDTLKMAVPRLEVATQQELKRAIAMEEPLVREYEKVNVYCFPYIDKNVLDSAGLVDAFIDWIRTYQKPSSDKASIAVAHGMELDESLYSPIFDMGYDYIALGHDHRQHAHSKNAWYAGSPERWRFDEIKHEKGFIVVDIEEDALNVTPTHLDFVRPVYNETLTIDSDDTVGTMIDKVRTFLDEKDLKYDWDISTAGRVRLVFEGSASRVKPMDLTIALENFRLEAFTKGSEYNLAQLVWTIRRDKEEFRETAYPEIESEYLIEDPEQDFREYVETLDIDEQYDISTLTKVAVKALRKAVNRDEEKLAYIDLSEDGEK